MTDLVTLTLDELADVLRHFMSLHSKVEPWEGLNETRRIHWRCTAAALVVDLEKRRAAASREQRARR